jgi:tRNA pseudouridine-54 N-methylase
MADTPNTYTKESLVSRVSSLVEEIRSQCEHLNRLSVEQGLCLSNGEVEALLDVFSRREPVLIALASKGEQISAILEDEGCVQTIGADMFTRAREELFELEQLAGTIRVRDAETHRQMQQQRDGLAGRLSSMGQKKSAMDAYSVSKGTPNPMIHDRRG